LEKREDEVSLDSRSALQLKIDLSFGVSNKVLA
jgi:hypothetical protein